MLKLKVEKRDLNENVDSLRAKSILPAVFYGKKDPSTPIKISLVDFKKVLKEAGESTIIKLEGDGIDVDVLVKDVTLHPVTDIIDHADFYAIEKGKKISVDVPLEFIGVSPAVKDLGAILVKVAHEVEIEALPKDLPHNLEVDLSTLVAFDSVITAGEIKLPEGVTLNVESDEVVASVYEPKEEVIEEAPADLSSIEVEKKGKEANESEEGESEDKAPGEKKEEKK